jgi:hypothetical protein
MPGDLPSGDKAVYLFFEMLALAFLFAAVDALIGSKPWYISAGSLALAVLFYLTGLKWPIVRSTIGSRLLFSVFLASVVLLSLSVLRWPSIKPGFVKVLGGCIAAYCILYVRSLRGDIQMYVMPRTITNRRAEELREYLSGRGPHTLTVKVSPFDQEAREYASQLFGALKQTEWNVIFSTSSADPNTLTEGLCLAVTGTNSRPSDPKQDPEQIIQEAFRAAHIQINAGSGAAAGTYALFLLVGPRPLKLGQRTPALGRLGRWLSSFGQ